MEVIIINGHEQAVQAEHHNNGEISYHIATYASNTHVVNLHQHRGICDYDMTVIVFVELYDNGTVHTKTRYTYYNYDVAISTFYKIVNKYDMVLCGVYPHILTQGKED
jgi:hypothetical protein